MKLSKFFDTNLSIDIEHLSSDSRQCKNNTMFFCLSGRDSDGHEHVNQAIENGAVCIVHKKDLQMRDDCTYIQVDDVDASLHYVVRKFYKNPSQQMCMIGVTGTNGKTTITSMVKDLLQPQHKVGYIGTLGIRYDEIDEKNPFTTPEPILLNATLAKMKQRNVQVVSMEVSSIALDLGRVKDIDFDVSVFTNFTHDHLDYHGSVDHYLESKLQLFKNMKDDGVCVLNCDDPTYTKVFVNSKGKVVTYGQNEHATFRFDDVVLTPEKTMFSLFYEGKEYFITSRFPALYNVYNLVASIAAIVASSLCSIEEVIEKINDLQDIDGRMNQIHEGQPFNVFIDFAHTPDALEKVYQYARSITPKGNSIISVFGSAGGRDYEKRPEFGRISSQYCDYVILTEDDPRTEEVKEIALEIKRGIQDIRSTIIEDRYNAIRSAIESANPDDTVLILGKGNETFMNRDVSVPWMGDDNASREIIHKYYFGEENE